MSGVYHEEVFFIESRIICLGFVLLQAHPGAIRRVKIDDCHTFSCDAKETREVVGDLKEYLDRVGAECRVINFYDLQHNITDADLAELAPFLEGLPRLEAVNFAYNRISEKGVCEHLIDLLRKRLVQYVVVTENAITMSDIPRIYGAIQQKTRTEEEDLEVFHKFVWVREAHLGTKRAPAIAIPRDSVVAHWGFYASIYARQLIRCGAKGE